MQISSLGVVHLGCPLPIHYHRNEMWPLQLNPQLRTNVALKLLDVLCGTIICMSMWKESDYSSIAFSDTTGTIRKGGSQEQEHVGIHLAGMIREAVMRTKLSQINW